MADERGKAMTGAESEPSNKDDAEKSKDESSETTAEKSESPAAEKSDEDAEKSESAESPAKSEGNESSSEKPASDDSAKSASDSDKPAGTASDTTAPGLGESPTPRVTGRNKILEKVLEEEPLPMEPPKAVRFSMVFDILLAVGLLVAMGGFTFGLFKMYLTHQAEQSILQQNFQAAISLLQGSRLPGVFGLNSEAEELLAKALYLDAIEKIETGTDPDGALKELEQIRPGSSYFIPAQSILSENFTPSTTTLQGSAEEIENNPEPPERKLGDEQEKPYNPPQQETQEEEETTETQPGSATPDAPAPQNSPAPQGSM
jgi:hypothetical protein